MKSCSYRHHTHNEYPGLLTTSRPNQTKAQGFALPYFLIYCAIFFAGAAVLCIRASEALSGSTRQQQTREALAIAEAGLEETLAALNSSHPYLLTQNHNPAEGQCWSSTSPCTTSTAVFKPAMCAGWTDTQQTSIPLSGTVSHSGNHTGNWRVIRYTFSGNPVFGGTGILRIEGLRRASATGPVLARAQLEQNMSVNLRGCSTANSTAAQNSIGLLAIGPEMNVQKTQILALDPTGNPNAPALVHCISCQQIVSAASCPSDALCHDSQAIGRWNFGQLPFPQVPQPPASLAAQPLTVSTTTELRVGSSNGGLCQLDGSGISHCRLSSLTINGNNILKVVYPASNSSSTIQRQLRLYLDGDLTISGGGKICQAIEDGTASPPCTLAPWSVGLGPTSLQLYGRSASSCGSGQSLTIAGGPQALSLFALLPCADVKINGGSSSPDIYGAIWSRSYQPTGSGNVDIWVPPDLNAALQNSLGSQFSIAIPRPIALGINRWVSYESVR